MDVHQEAELSYCTGMDLCVQDQDKELFDEYRKISMDKCIVDAKGYYVIKNDGKLMSAPLRFQIYMRLFITALIQMLIIANNLCKIDFDRS